MGGVFFFINREGKENVARCSITTVYDVQGETLQHEKTTQMTNFILVLNSANSFILFARLH